MAVEDMIPMSVQKTSALVIVLGSVLFLVAAFSPTSQVFVEPSAARKLDIITASRAAWTIAQVLFAMGALLTVLGVALAAVHFRDQPVSPLLYASVAILLVGVVPWVWHVYLRGVDPAAFTDGALPVWHFAGYSLLTLTGFALFGAALLRIGLLQWVGWMLIGSMALFFVVWIISRDLPPLIYYLPTVIAGIMLYRAG